MVKKSMWAANLHAPGDLRIEEIPLPEPGPQDAIIKVTACGVCGSDVPRVLTAGTYHFPTVPGHEFGGVVVEKGSGVQRVKVGQRVAVIPLIPCRRCKLCEIGQFAQCESYGFLGSRDDGGFAEYVRVPEDNLITVPDGVSDEASALLEAVTVALHVVQNMGVAWGDNVAVFGMGAIGNFVAQWAKAFGVKRIFAVDVDDRKLEIARKVGLSDTICSAGIDTAAHILKATGGTGVDIAVEAAGAGSAFSQAVSVLRLFGRLGLVGRPVRDISVTDKTFEKILRSQLTIKGTWSFEFMGFPHNAWMQSLDAITKGQIVIDPLITHRLPLDKTFDAIKMMADKREFIQKIIIKP